MMNVAVLQKEHNVELFDCGSYPLNIFFKEHALHSQASHTSRTYVLSDRKNQIIGYYSLVYGSISPQTVSERVRQGTGNYPLPIIIIARLAVDRMLQGQGFGKTLLKDALTRCLHASEIAGLRAVVVNAKDLKAKEFYEKYGFEASPFDEFHLFLLMKNLKKNLKVSQLLSITE